MWFKFGDRFVRLGGVLYLEVATSSTLEELDVWKEQWQVRARLTNGDTLSVPYDSEHAAREAFAELENAIFKRVR